MTTRAWMFALWSSAARASPGGQGDLHGRQVRGEAGALTHASG